MPVRGVDKVRSKLASTFEKIKGPMTEETIVEVLIIGGSYSDRLTPMELGTLVGSRFREVRRGANGWAGRYGYTAKYAAAVHEKPGTLAGEPRASGRGKYWDPDGEPQWLVKGFERDGLQDIRAAIKRNMQL